MAAAPPHSKVPSSHHAACAEVPDVGGTVPFRCVSLPPLECKPRVQLLFLRTGQGHELIRPLPSAPPLLEPPSRCSLCLKVWRCVLRSLSLPLLSRGGRLQHAAHSPPSGCAGYSMLAVQDVAKCHTVD